MQPITDVQLTAMVVAMVAMVRAQFPKVDGKAYVFAVALLVAVGLSFLFGGQTIRETVVHGIVVALTATGGMQAVGYLGDKVRGQDAPVVTFTGPFKTPEDRS